MQKRLVRTLLKMTFFWALSLTPCFAGGNDLQPTHIFGKDGKFYLVESVTDAGVTAHRLSAKKLAKAKFTDQFEGQPAITALPVDTEFRTGTALEFARDGLERGALLLVNDALELRPFAQPVEQETPVEPAGLVEVPANNAPQQGQAAQDPVDDGVAPKGGCCSCKGWKPNWKGFGAKEIFTKPNSNN